MPLDATAQCAAGGDAPAAIFYALVALFVVYIGVDTALAAHAVQRALATAA